MKKTKTRTLGTRVADEVADKLMQYAERRGVTMSQAIAELVEKALIKES